MILENINKKRISFSRYFFQFFSIFFPAIYIYGCVYTFTSFLPSHIKSIAIPIPQSRAKNLPYKLELQEKLFNEIREQFIKNNTLAVLDEDFSDSILELTIVEYRVFPYTKIGAEITEYRLSITISVEFRDIKESRILWKEEKLNQEELFTVESQDEEIEKKEFAAAEKLVRKFGNIILDRVVTGW